MDAAAIARTLAEAAAERRTVRPVGGGTKLGWVAEDADETIPVGGLNEIVEHNEGDLTAVLQAGVSLAAAQERFAAAGQMLALDPPNPGGRATVGGVLASGDSGPLRHRYGAVRDLVLGIQVALSDGTVARAGSKVIKNVAGYDLAKLFCGSFGSLGVVCEVTVRLHPLTARTTTVRGLTADAGALAAAARAVSAAPLELDALDLAWASGRGALLARGAGADALMREHGLDVDVVEDDDGLWQAQRAHQRGALVARISGLPSRWEDLLGADDELVGRASLGLAWVRLADRDALARLRERVSPLPVVVQDGATKEDREWGPAASLMRRVKERFDPHDVLVGGPAA